MMLKQEQAADIFDRIRKASTAGEVEVTFSGGSSSLTRFANNVIHQNMTEENASVSIRVAMDGRTAPTTFREHSRTHTPRSCTGCGRHR